MKVLKIGTIARAAWRFSGEEASGWLDLDHVGAPIGQLSHCSRTGSDLGEVKNRELRKRLRCPREGHDCTSSRALGGAGLAIGSFA